MWPFGKVRKLIGELDSLAIYNDKGISWSKHSPDQVAAERTRRMDKIQSLVQAIGRDELPAEFIASLDSGLVATDGTGRYPDLIKGRSHGRATV